MSDFRRAFLWFAGFVALVIAGDRLLAAALQNILLRSHFRFSQVYRGGNEARTIVIGDSRGVHAFFTPEVARLTGRPALNLAFNSMSSRIAEAVIADYLEHNAAPEVAILEVTNLQMDMALATELRTYALSSRRLRELYAERHGFAAALGRVFHLLQFNSEFFLRALVYLRRDDQVWSFTHTLPAVVPEEPGWTPGIRPENLAALARSVRLLESRGVTVRLIVAPYFRGPALLPMPDYLRKVENAVGGGRRLKVLDYRAALTEHDAFADRIHLNEEGSRRFLQILHRDGVLNRSLTRPPSR